MLATLSRACQINGITQARRMLQPRFIPTWRPLQLRSLAIRYKDGKPVENPALKPKKRNYALAGKFVLGAIALPFLVLFFTRRLRKALGSIEEAASDHPLVIDLQPSPEEEREVHEKLNAFLEDSSSGLILSSHELNVLIASTQAFKEARGKIAFHLIDDNIEVLLTQEIELIEDGVVQPQIKYFNALVNVDLNWDKQFGRWQVMVTKILPTSGPESIPALDRKYRYTDFHDQLPIQLRKVLERVQSWEVRAGDLCINIKHPSMITEEPLSPPMYTATDVWQAVEQDRVEWAANNKQPQPTV